MAGDWAVALNGASSICAGLGLIVASRRADRRAAARAVIVTTGLAGMATITAFDRAGAGDGEKRSRYRIELDVALPDRPVYPVTVIEAVPPSAVPRYQPGWIYPVGVDPDDLAAVFLIDTTDIIWASPDVTAAGLSGTATVTGCSSPRPTRPSAAYRSGDWPCGCGQTTTGRPTTSGSSPPTRRVLPGRAGPRGLRSGSTATTRAGSRSNGQL